MYIVQLYRSRTHIIARFVTDEAGLAVDALPGLGIDLISQVLGVVQTGGVNCKQRVDSHLAPMLIVSLTCGDTVLACDQLLILEVALIAVKTKVGVGIRLLVHGLALPLPDSPPPPWAPLTCHASAAPGRSPLPPPPLVRVTGQGG